MTTWIKNKLSFLGALKSKRAVVVYVIIALAATNVGVFMFTQSTTGKALIYFAQNHSEVITKIDEMRVTKEAQAPKE